MRGMEDDIGRSEEIVVAVEELDACLLCPTDVTSIANVLERATKVDTGDLYSSRGRKDLRWQTQGGLRFCEKGRKY